MCRTGWPRRRRRGSAWSTCDEAGLAHSPGHQELALLHPHDLHARFCPPERPQPLLDLIRGDFLLHESDRARLVDSQQSIVKVLGLCERECVDQVAVEDAARRCGGLEDDKGQLDYKGDSERALYAPLPLYVSQSRTAGSQAWRVRGAERCASGGSGGGGAGGVSRVD